jgi:hypothetical protein
VNLIETHLARSIGLEATYNVELSSAAGSKQMPAADGAGSRRTTFVEAGSNSRR